MYACAVIGAGPAGTGALRQLADAGVRDIAVIDPCPVNRAGTLADYAIGSDTRASKLLSLFPDGPSLADARRRLSRYGHGSAPLQVAGEALRDLGSWCVRKAAAQPIRARATSLQQQHEGWQIPTSGGLTLQARSVVLALGGVEVAERGPALLKQYGIDRPVLLSGKVLAGHAKPSGHVAILGGSHSAMAVAGWLLRKDPEVHVTLLHRSALNPTYANIAEATAEGAAFTADDVCAQTGRVFALGGFRLDAAELLLRYRAGREPRLSLLQTDQTDLCHDTLQDADTVVSALGYAPRSIPVFDLSGRVTDLQPHVDSASRVTAKSGAPLPGLFRLGLAAGLDLAGRFGEPGFRGQANGLALWHRDVGADIASRVKARADADLGTRHDENKLQPLRTA